MIIGLLLAAGYAVAGPQIHFGSNDEGLFQIDYKGQFQGIYRDSGSGPDGADETMQFNFRRNRIALMGKYGEIMSLYVQTEFVEDQSIGPVSVNKPNDPQFEMIDATARFQFADWFRVSVGKFKYNFTRENLEACENPLTLDRSLFIRAPYVATRDKGVAVWGNIFDGMVQYRLDAMNGRGVDVSSDGSDPEPQSSFRYSARAHLSLLDPEKDYGYKGTYLGMKKVLTVGGAVQYEPKAVYADYLNETDAKDYIGYTADIFFEYPSETLGTVTLSGAYEKIEFDDAYKGANPGAGAIGLTGEKNGYYGKAAYMLPDTPLQLFGRYETWRFASLNGVSDQEVQWYAGGVNYYFREQNLKLTVEGSQTAFDKIDPYTDDYVTVVTQLQVLF
jgi:hypothetical protein